MTLTLTNLTAIEARQLTDQIRSDGADLWRKVAEINDRKGYEALGYESLGEWGKAELDYSASYTSRMLQASQVVAALPIGKTGSGVPVPNEAQARELAKLIKDPEAMSAAWAGVVESGDRTAAKVAAAVRALKGDNVKNPRGSKGEPETETTRDAEIVDAEIVSETPAPTDTEPVDAEIVDDPPANVDGATGEIAADETPVAAVILDSDQLVTTLTVVVDELAVLWDTLTRAQRGQAIAAATKLTSKVNAAPAPSAPRSNDVTPIAKTGKK